MMRMTTPATTPVARWSQNSTERNSFMASDRGSSQGGAASE
jgi:hypothetical protein